MSEPLTINERREALRRLSTFCHNYLVSEPNDVYTYLTHIRKLSHETIVKFKLGRYPTSPFVLNALYDRIGKTNAFKLGIVAADPQSKQIVSRLDYYPIVIPIEEYNNQPQAFICRTMLSDTDQHDLSITKYWNLSFKKSRNLYGLNHAIPAIKRLGEVNIVEGNFDVIMAHQHGMENTVGISMTSMSAQQVVMCARYAKKINLYLDNDEAGRKATIKILEKFNYIKDKIDIVAATIPTPYKDLAEYLEHK